ncbi:MAG: class IV adenylate cyclase [Pirellulaceae bacterium]
MLYEVENKFPVPVLAAVEQRLQAYGARFGPAVEQVDHYFAHPEREFAKTDEALRLRRVGDSNWVTYKGPKIDQATKTRQELELPLAAGQDLVPRYAQLLLALGFRSVAEVVKSRRSADFIWQDWRIAATLDEVEGLGRFVELEIQVDAAGLRAAQAGLLALAAELGLNEVERRSYLEMLLES